MVTPAPSPQLPRSFTTLKNEFPEVSRCIHDSDALNYAHCERQVERGGIDRIAFTWFTDDRELLKSLAVCEFYLLEEERSTYIAYAVWPDNDDVSCEGETPELALDLLIEALEGLRGSDPRAVACLARTVLQEIISSRSVVAEQGYPDRLQQLKRMAGLEPPRT